ncbi:hypothetical protein B9Q13_05055 [Candidatus Marsarchaeota G2 archaeon ECH_B_SAG-G16]|uniref:ABC transporter domain-containing protein n=1 Tax=Candidatus Marsarchaeota G2 archaeon ECH_B_SAG-G16 TaxID=1978167 RepID=A0A2R6C0F2_9ARCH|nr:MAG: hypothetical protein B9Q13_05055 [Candidatus Marsarchaeota G2 archaeon ECH_B_SAG-G16]
MKSLICAENLSFRYHGSKNWALKEVDLKISQGEFVLICGQSGSGKSTLLRCFNGLVPQFYQGDFVGEVFVDGMNTKHTPVYKLSQIAGLVFSDPESQLITLEVERDVAFGPENLGLNREEIVERVEWAINSVNISHIRHKPPFELSGGEQQKAAIASILALKPKILVLDEPTANLDPVSAKNVIELVSSLNSKGVTVVCAEHRLEMLSSHAMRVIVLNEGSILMDDRPEKVFSSDIIEEIGIEAPSIYRFIKFAKDTGVNLPLLKSWKELFQLLHQGTIVDKT